MTKNKFAGLAEAKMKSLDENSLEEEPRESSDAPKTKDSIKPTRKSASKLAVKKSSKLAGNKASSKVVGVTIRIPEEKRVWWNVQAKLRRITLTEAIIEALDERFGPPRKI